jgi:ceramidase
MRPLYKTLLLVLAAAAASAAAFTLDPVPQDPAYHAFADARTFFGVPNFWNVASNLPFLAVGIAGLALSRRPAEAGLALHYRVFCAALALVAIGSAYYHLAPSTPALAWDRLPMTVAFMALFAAVLADRVSWLAGRALLWPLVAAGLASIAWWLRTEAAGRGDLRAYGLVQFLPMLLMPLILALWRGGALASSWLWGGFGGYAAAKLAEHFDAAIFAGTGGAVSGHSLKHVAAAAAAACLVRAFQKSPASAL